MHTPTAGLLSSIMSMSAAKRWAEVIDKATETDVRDVHIGKAWGEIRSFVAKEAVFVALARTCVLVQDMQQLAAQGSLQSELEVAREVLHTHPGSEEYILACPALVRAAALCSLALRPEQAGLSMFAVVGDYIQHHGSARRFRLLPGSTDFRATPDHCLGPTGFYGAERFMLPSSPSDVFVPSWVPLAMADTTRVLLRAAFTPTKGARRGRPRPT